MEITADWTDRDQRERQQRSTVLVLLSFSFSLCSIWLIAFDASSCSSLFYVRFTQDTVNAKNDCWALKPFSQRNKNISSDLSSLLRSMALVWGLRVSRAIISCNVSPTVSILHCVTLITESALPFGTSWLNEYRHTAIVSWSEPILSEIHQ